MIRTTLLLSFVLFACHLTACSGGNDRPEKAAEAPAPSEEATPPAGPVEVVKSESPVSVSEQAAAPIEKKTGRKGSQAAAPSARATDEAPKPATAPQTSVVKEEAGGDPPSHDRWNDQLRRYVNASGQVDYQAWKKEKGQLEKYLSELAAHPVHPNWSRAEQLAYWINAYNAFTVKLILDNYPLGSITDLHGGKPWDVQWIELGERTYSLNNIENDILRPRYQEPHIHFALNCAARSCPPLLNRAWTADNLERLFEQQTKAFINDPQYNQLAPEAVQISRIFDWYAADFDDLIAFLNRYATGVTIRPDAKVSYLEYDWGLNEK